VVSAGNRDSRITSLLVTLPDGGDRGGGDNVIAVEDNDRVADMRFGMEEGVTGSELRLLGDVGDVEFPVATVLEVGLDPFTVQADDKYNLSHECGFEFCHDVIENWPISDGEHRFRSVFRERPQATAILDGEDDGLHVLRDW